VKILFRVSGGRAPRKQIGFGHLHRTINLAQELKKNKIMFMCDDYDGAIEFFRNFGYKKNVIAIPKNLESKIELKKTINIIKQNSIDLTIVDKFNIPISLVKKIHSVSKVAVVSDLDKIDFPADIVFNGFIGFKNKIFINRFGTKCFVGPRYQIINRNFRTIKPHKKKLYDILATFGGFDENNIIDYLLDSLENWLSKLKIKIILGPSTKKTIKTSFFEKMYKKNLTILQSTNNMAKEMVNASIGLCSGGITTYEFASMQLPFGIISQVKHQLKTASEWEKKGYGRNLGIINNNLRKKLDNFIVDVVNGNINYKSKKLVDADGSKRVAKEIMNMM